MLDGEIMLLERGVPSFAALTGRLQGAVPPAVAAARPVTFMVFDVLRLYGVRRSPAARWRSGAPHWSGWNSPRRPRVAVSPAYTDGPALLAATAQQGMEGVVAKRARRPVRGRGAQHRLGRR